MDFEQKYQQVLLIGVGLIGGSLVKALRANDLVANVIGIDVNAQELQKAINLGVIDEISALEELDNLGKTKKPDLIIVATPVGAMFTVFAALKKAGLTDVLMTDVGSTKQSVINSAQLAFGDLPINYVPSHPIAGKENSGVDYADANLFINSRAIVTPHAKSSQLAVDNILKMWQQVGAIVDTATAKRHDHVLAATSHLPHVLAYNLVNSLSATQEAAEIFTYAAGGFKSSTRTASSNPIMWRDICINNKEEIIFWLEHYQQKLDEMRQLIEQGDAENLEKIFTKAKMLRDDNLVNHQFGNSALKE